MFYTVSFLASVCDNGVTERVTRHFDDFVDAVGFWAECSDAEDAAISLASLNEEADALS